jgi:hypothetical protein
MKHTEGNNEYLCVLCKQYPTREKNFLWHITIHWDIQFQAVVKDTQLSAGTKLIYCTRNVQT